MSAASIADWSTLLSVEAETAATLTGLVFVAVSINLDKIMVFPGLPGRALESTLQFVEVFLISTVVLIPSQPERVLAVELLGVGLFFWIVQVVVLVRYLKVREGQPM